MTTITKIPNPIDTSNFLKVAAVAVMTLAVYEVSASNKGNDFDCQVAPAVIQRDSTSLIAEGGETVLKAFGVDLGLPLKWVGLAKNCGVSEDYFRQILSLASSALNSWGGSFSSPILSTVFDEDDALDTLVIEFPVSADLESAVDLSIDIGMFLFERLQLPHNVLVRCESIG